MKVQSKKYFIILFSLTSLVAYANEGEEETNSGTCVTNIRMTQEQNLPDTEKSSRTRECFDDLWSRKRAVLEKIDPFYDGMNDALKELKNMVGVVNYDPGCGLSNGLNFGIVTGLVNASLMQALKNKLKLRVTASFVLPVCFVSYLLASQNAMERDLRWQYRQLASSSDMPKKSLF